MQNARVRDGGENHANQTDLRRENARFDMLHLESDTWSFDVELLKLINA